MNILISGSRNLTPEQDWANEGIRRLIKLCLGQRINLVSFDPNPDLLRGTKPYTHRPVLHSNSFHHATALPFNLAVISGQSSWSGEPLERLYGALEATKAPVWLLGVEEPSSGYELTTLDRHLMARTGSRVTAASHGASRWLSARGFTPTLLSNPSLFAKAQTEDSQVRSRYQVGCVLEDPHRAGRPARESDVRNLLKVLSRLEKQVSIRIICPHVDDFLRYSSVFPKAVFHSSDPNELLSAVEDCEVVVTTNRQILTGIHSSLRTAVLLTETPDADLNPLLTVQSGAASLAEVILSTLKDSESKKETLLKWKSEELAKWVKWFRDASDIRSRNTESPRYELTQ